MSRTLQVFIVVVQVTVIILFSTVSLPGFTQAQPGFLSIDCGSSVTYTDANSITWVPDTGYIFTGQNYDLAQNNNTQLQTLRYFSENRSKSCYVLPAIPLQTYMVRVSFFYSDFLGTGTPPPTFRLEIEVEYAGLINSLQDPDVFYEVMLSATRDNICVCLARSTTTDVPFISALELRALDTASMYTVVQQGVYLYNRFRHNFGTTTDSPLRYPDDKYDRRWWGHSVAAPVQAISTTTPVNVSLSSHMVPEAVMRTALVWPSGETMYLPLSDIDASNKFYYFVSYFAEIDPQAVNQSRVFDMVLNSNPALGFANVSVTNLAGGMYVTTELLYANFTSNNTGLLQFIPHLNSALGPIFNAYEMFLLSGPVTLMRTFYTDALAIENLKETLNLTSWTGDPCVYTPYDWITCTNDPSPRIATVKLSDYNLTGTIPQALSNLTALTALWLDHNYLEGTIPDLSDLTNLHSLRLQNNQLTGFIPMWLQSLTSLQELVLSNNNLTGTVPPTLVGNANLTFQDFGNPYLCTGVTTCPTTTPTNHGSNYNKSNVVNLTTIVGVTVGGLLLVIVIILLVFYFICFRKRVTNSGPKEALAMAKLTEPAKAGDNTPEGSRHYGVEVVREFSFVEVVAATNSFKTLLGEGSFGCVYYGRLLNGQEVAVKRSSPNSQQGLREFVNEINLLSKVHHKYLVSLVGYCHEDKEQILIYEYMANGTLRQSLYGTQKALENPIDWKARLNIALNCAEGLEYLHTGCNCPIIHRDLKTSNILLSKQMVAKVGDFGLSKMISIEGASHVTTMAKGTAGYIDPEYNNTQQLTNKSDIFSLGIILLELLCGRPPIDRSLPDQTQWNIGEWVRTHLREGAINDVIDKAFHNNYNMESMWKVAEIAIMSIEPCSVNRPTITQVVSNLREAIIIESSVEPSYNTSSDMSNSPLLQSASATPRRSSDTQQSRFGGGNNSSLTFTSSYIPSSR